ncbi:MAG: hypothetical protein JNM93_11485 [Bacteriovoracaceae bacterium]|nr:hypothetical protein [Bacteriovoracaceae bacterium]
MNNLKLKDIVVSFMITTVLLLFLEVFSSSFLPAVGLDEYRLGFHVLIVLFIAFRIESIYLPYLVLGFELIHSIFSIEGWASGTFAGVVICFLISYLKDLIQLNSRLSTIVIVQIFQTVWFLIVAGLITIKTDEMSYFLLRLPRFVSESLFLSLISPLFFELLSRFWKTNRDGQGVGI